MKKIVVGFLLLLCVTFAHNVRAEIRTFLSVSKVTLGENFSLNLIENGNSKLNGDIDTTPLEKDFTVISSNKSFKSVMINGKIENNTEINITLLPKKEGNIQIPSLTINGEKTSILNIEVLPASSSYTPQSAIQNEKIFLKATVDNANPFEQEQVIYTLKAYVPQSVNIINGSFGKVISDKAIIEPMTQIKKYQSNFNNKMYWVYEGKYAIFPAKTGEIYLDSDGVRFIIEDNSQQNRHSAFPDVFGGRFNMFAPQKDVFLKQDKILINVKPRPKFYDDKLWLPAISLAAEFNLPSAEQTFKTGEPINISITLNAVGLLEQQLPDLQMPEVEGLKIYESDVKKENFFNKNVNSTKEVSFVIIPVQNGNFSVPEFNLNWFNVKTKQNEVITIPRINIEAFGKKENTQKIIENNEQIKSEPENIKSEIIVQPSKIENKYYLIILGVIGGIGGCLLVVAGYIWLLSRKNKLEKSSYEKDLKLIKVACELSNTKLIQEALLKWAKKYLNSNINSVTKIADELENVELKQKLEQLNKNIYSNQPLNFDGQEIYQSLKKALKNRKNLNKKSKKVLPNLYPF